MIQNRIKEARNALKFSRQEEFAKNLDIPFGTYQRYENNTETKIPHTFFDKMREKYGISADWLIFGTGEMFIHQKQCTNAGEELKPMIDLLEKLPKKSVQKLYLLAQIEALDSS
ncbi:hypothetical protein AGMMS50229_06980 [Campylobacterota bacterium]|nr:hypothetical protein AGMMS50229_06980 [Campylobacterota bacterium]